MSLFPSSRPNLVTHFNLKSFVHRTRFAFCGKLLSLTVVSLTRARTDGGGMTRINALLASVVLATGLSVAFSQKPDNTKMNKQEQPTADQAKNNKGDLKLEKQI